ncbi:MAG: hypothetical protein HKM95_09790 [Inquilinus sp.]|nr:hypothetical protein [Inquilinus sp.]
MPRPWLVAALALVACDPREPDTGAEAGASDPPGAVIEVPRNAIRLHDQFYMVPLDERVGGCQAYRAFSPTGRVPQAIYYRTPDGRFVMDRGLAVCD